MIVDNCFLEASVFTTVFVTDIGFLHTDTVCVHAGSAPLDGLHRVDRGAAAQCRGRGC